MSRIMVCDLAGMDTKRTHTYKVLFMLVSTIIVLIAARYHTKSYQPISCI
jgi:hypothetical protein